jgi:molecular chaperone DnaK
MDGGSKDDIETKTRELSESLSKIGQAMYGSQGTPDAQTEATGSEEKKDETKEERKKRNQTLKKVKLSNNSH